MTVIDWIAKGRAHWKSQPDKYLIVETIDDIYRAKKEGKFWEMHDQIFANQKALELLQLSLSDCLERTIGEILGTDEELLKALRPAAESGN